MEASSSKVLLLEAFFGGSHKQLVDHLMSEHMVEGTYELFTHQAKKWQWKMRCSSLAFAGRIPLMHRYKVLFCSCVFNLAELLGVRPDLHSLKKILYFHENQLAYPKQTDHGQRDFQFGWTQIASAMAADIVVFNSEYNMRSFLENIDTFVNKQVPADGRPRGLADVIKPKSCVVPYPLPLEKMRLDFTKRKCCIDGPLTILWPHRWEFDKNPELFFNTLMGLKKSGENFRLVVLGEQFSEIPEIFETAKGVLEDNLLHYGYVASRDEYYEWLARCDVVVSTSKHEFFGVAMIEAMVYGCYPIAPNDLVYPEYIEKQCLYNTEAQFSKMLRNCCRAPQAIRQRDTSSMIKRLMDKYKWETVQPLYKALLEDSLPSSEHLEKVLALCK